MNISLDIWCLDLDFELEPHGSLLSYKLEVKSKLASQRTVKSGDEKRIARKPDRYITIKFTSELHRCDNAESTVHKGPEL